MVYGRGGSTGCIPIVMGGCIFVITSKFLESGWNYIKNVREMGHYAVNPVISTPLLIPFNFMEGVSFMPLLPT